jgi:hypothetical protein
MSISSDGHRTYKGTMTNFTTIKGWEFNPMAARAHRERAA